MRRPLGSARDNPGDKRIGGRSRSLTCEKLLTRPQTVAEGEENKTSRGDSEWFWHRLQKEEERIKNRDL